MFLDSHTRHTLSPHPIAGTLLIRQFDLRRLKCESRFQNRIAHFNHQMESLSACLRSMVYYSVSVAITPYYLLELATLD